VLGTLTISSPLDRKPIDLDDEAMLLDLADRAALAIRSARLHEAALAAIRSREDLLAVVSHDLRNLVQTVALGVTVVEQVALDEPRIAKATLSMSRSLDRMETLIKNLLDVALIDSGTLHVEPTPVSVRQLIDEMVAVHQPLAAERSLTLASHIGPAVDRVLATRDLLAQVLANLLGNALKFTPAEGSVTVSAEHDGQYVAISVTDTGQGIDPADLPYVFDRYWQARRRAEQAGGVGLGLAIVRGIVTALGGDVQVDSELDRGTTFRFRLPAA
jgi:signal transduction histidine kinase